jgi:hypothetical protein
MAILSSEASQLMKMNFIRSSSSTDRVRAISRLLFRLVDPDQAIHLLDSNLSLSEKREVQDSLGQGFRLLIGQPTGHYKLNLGDAQHRDILQRLMIVNKEDRAWLSARYPDLDTSQHGNGQRFRNEKLDRVKIELHPRMFQSVRAHDTRSSSAACMDLFILALVVLQLPSAGLLEFDYVVAKRPSSRLKPVHSITLSRILQKAGVHQLVLKVGGSAPEFSEADDDSAVAAAVASHTSSPSHSQGMRTCLCRGRDCDWNDVVALTFSRRCVVVRSCALVVQTSLPSAALPFIALGW